MLMKSSDKEKYLGDYIQKKGNSKETTKDGNILSNMRVILQDIPLGSKKNPNWTHPLTSLVPKWLIFQQ